jgi:hypothetical protein
LENSIEFENNQPIIEVKKINKINPWIRKSIQLCTNENIQVILFTSPYFNSKEYQNFDLFNSYKRPYWNFANTLKNKELFFDNSHINHQGAILFTDTFACAFSSHHNLIYSSRSSNE